MLSLTSSTSLSSGTEKSSFIHVINVLQQKYSSTMNLHPTHRHRHSHSHSDTSLDHKHNPEYSTSHDSMYHPTHTHHSYRPSHRRSNSVKERK